MTSLWLRAPLLLWRRAGVAAALFLAAFVAVAPAAAQPMLVSSASAAALHSRVGAACPWLTGSQFTGALTPGTESDPDAALHARTDPEARAFSRVPRVSGDPVVTVFRYGIFMDTPHGHEPSSTRLAARTGYADHVKVLSGPSGDGLWVPSRVAAKAHLRVGDQVSLVNPDQSGNPLAPPSPPFHATVAAIYADLRDTPVDPDFWCSTSWLYKGRGAEGNTLPIPDLVLASQSTVLAAERTLGTVYPEISGVDIERTVDITGASQPQTQRVADAIHRAQGRALKDMPATYFDFPNHMRSDIDAFSQRAGLVGRSVAPVAAAMSVAGSAVGLLALAAATSFWVRRRRRELVVLATHGVGPVALGVKGGLEALPAVVLGGAVACAGTSLAIRDAGPSRLLDPHAVDRGLLYAAVLFAACLAVVVITATAGARALIDVPPRLRRRGGWWRRVPWELAAAGAGAALWSALGSARSDTLTGDQAFGTVAVIPLRLYVTPPLVLLGALVLVVRLAAWALSRRSVAARRPAGRAGPVDGPPGDRPARAEAPRDLVGGGWTGRALSATTVFPDRAEGPAVLATSIFRDRGAGTATATDGGARERRGGPVDAPVARTGRRRGVVGLLVWRRLGRDAVAAAILAVATGLPVGLAVFGATAAQTASGTLVAQARLQNGADVVIHLSAPAPIPDSLRGQATQVRRIDGVELGDFSVSVLEIDPATFARGAYWDDRLGGGDLAALLADVGDGASGGGAAARVVAAHPAAGGDQPMQLGAGPPLTVRVHAVPLLPASQGGYPTVLAPTGIIGRLDAGEHVSDTVLWVRGDPADIHRKALAAHLPVAAFSDATTLYTHTWIEPVTYTFTYTIAICALMGLITSVGLVLYLEAGLPARKRAWVMLRRMGLRPGAHRRSLLGQIAVPVALGALLGGAGAAGLALLTRADMDVDPRQAPGALLAVPGQVIGVVGLVVAVVVAATVAVTHLRTIRAHPSVVLRDVQ